MGGIALVLGAGGIVGQAYHAGVLAAIEEGLGWDARDASLVVGTSAGAITAAVLRSGVPAVDLAAWATKAPLSDEGAMLAELFGDSFPELEPIRLSELMSSAPTLPHRSMIGRLVVRPWQFRPMAAALALLGPGSRDIVAHLGALSDIEPSAWPGRPLWICAVRRRDGRRVVFGRAGSPAAPLHLAVAASCAVPGYFAPVHIGSHAYVDGGAHSPTNAATVRLEPVDAVLIVSPMSGPAATPRTLTEAARWHANRKLAREVAALRRAGKQVEVLEPSRRLQKIMGNDMLSAAPVDDVIAEAHAAGLVRAQEEGLAQLLTHA